MYIISFIRLSEINKCYRYSILLFRHLVNLTVNVRVKTWVTQQSFRDLLGHLADLTVLAHHQDFGRLR